MILANSSLQFDHEIKAIRDSKILGESGRLVELFEYLVAKSHSNEPLSEMLVAAEIFGKKDFSATSDDATVRVYIHRLRKKLEDFYQSEQASLRPCRLIIPRGEYRLALETLKLVNPQSSGRNKLYFAVATVLLVNLCIWWLVINNESPIRKGQEPSALTAVLAQDTRPVTILVGDYFMFGETEDGYNPSRLIRDFDVNSAADREKYYPDAMDVGLTYLPPSAAYALSDIVPLVDQSGRNYRVLKISEANANILKDSDVIYLGLFSGLGFLEPIIFENSNFVIGDSYDEILDIEDGHNYTSTESEGLIEGLTYEDYGYFQLRHLNSDNMLLVIAGTRDTGLRGISELIASKTIPPYLEQLEEHDHYEALFGIEGQQQANIKTHLLKSD